MERVIRFLIDLTKKPAYTIAMTKGISIDPSVCHGKPVIMGTRVLVSTILGALAGGDTYQMVEEDYGISAEQISDVLQFASDVSDFQLSSYETVA